MNQNTEQKPQNISKNEETRSILLKPPESLPETPQKPLENHFIGPKNIQNNTNTENRTQERETVPCFSEKLDPKLNNSNNSSISDQNNTEKPSEQIRVKLYLLSNEGKWEDFGRVGCLTHFRVNGGIWIRIADEETNSTIKVHCASSNIDYERQGSTIITWSAEELDNDLALSFQKASDCDFVFKLLNNSSNILVSRNVSDELRSDLDKLDNNCVDSDEALPDPSIANVNMILEIVQAFSSWRGGSVRQFLRNNFIEKLLKLHKIAEDLEDIKSLDTIFLIIKHLILINDFELMWKLLKFENIIDVIGALEYTPNRPNHFRSNCHKERDFLATTRKHDSPVPFSDDAISKEVDNMIRHAYLLKFFRDVVFLRWIDDQVSVTLNVMIMQKESCIVQHLLAEGWFSKVFKKMKGKTLNEDSESDFEEFDMKARLSLDERKHYFSFFSEFIRIVKSLSLEERFTCVDSLLKTPDFLEMIEFVTNEAHSSQDQWLWNMIAESIDFIVIFKPSFFRLFCVSSRKKINIAPSVDRTNVPEVLRIIGRLVDVFVCKDPKMDVGTVSVLRFIIQKSLEPDFDQRNTAYLIYLDKFYIYEIPKLIKSASNPSKNEISYYVCYHSLELLHFCAVSHKFHTRSTSLILALQKTVQLLSSHVPSVVLSAVRFLRASVSINDNTIMRFIIENDLFAPIFDIFIKNGDRYNLLNSSILDLFDFIRKMNPISLIRYLVEKHFDRVGKVKYVTIFDQIRESHDKNMDSGDLSSVTSSLDVVDEVIQKEDKMISKNLDLILEESYFLDDESDEEAEKQMINNGKNPDKIDDSVFIERKKSSNENSEDKEIDLCSLSNSLNHKKKSLIGFKFSSSSIQNKNQKENSDLLIKKRKEIQDLDIVNGFSKKSKIEFTSGGILTSPLNSLPDFLEIKKNEECVDKKTNLGSDNNEKSFVKKKEDNDKAIKFIHS